MYFVGIAIVLALVGCGGEHRMEAASDGGAGGSAAVDQRIDCDLHEIWDDREACLAAGGVPECAIVCFCACPTSDGGAPCRDERDCQGGHCLADRADATAGACSETTLPMGFCAYLMDDGVAEGLYCLE